MAEACARTGWPAGTYVLMPNRLSLVVEMPQLNLVAGMKWLLGTYTSRFHRRQKLFGHLFSGRCKSLIVEGSGNGYLKIVDDFVDLNPARAELVAVVRFPAAAKGVPEKVARAARLRAETATTVGWIAGRLGRGTRGHLNHLLYRQRKSGV